MFWPEIYGLEYRIPGLNIRTVEKKGRIFGKGVEIQFIDVGGGDKSVRLHLKRRDDFIAAVGNISDIVGNKPLTSGSTGSPMNTPPGDLDRSLATKWT